VLLDVRPAAQFDVVHLPGALNVPFDHLDRRLDEVLRICGAPASCAAAAATIGGEVGAAAGGAEDGQQLRPAVYVMCRRGNHSQLAVRRLMEAGVGWARDCVGGMNQWSAEVDGRVPLL
jgi:adenylyltransferase/sulfurtransferase